MTSDKVAYKSKRHINDEQIDEKLRTQTFRFTNQFKSEDGCDQAFFKGEEMNEEIYGEFIEEEIESKSQDSTRNNTKPMHLIKDAGPHEIPSDSNPYKNKKNYGEDSVEMTGTPISRPPKVPSKLNTKNNFQSPAQQIFKTSKQKQKENDLPLNKQNSEPAKHVSNIFSSKFEEERKFDHLLDSDINNDVQGASSSQQNNHKSEVESVLLKIRSEYTKESLLKCPFKSPIKELVKFENDISDGDD